MVLRPLEMLKLTLAILSPTLLLPFLPTLMILKGRPPGMPPSLSPASNVLQITNEPTSAAFAYPNFVQLEPGGQRSVHSDFHCSRNCNGYSVIDGSKIQNRVRYGLQATSCNIFSSSYVMLLMNPSICSGC